MAKLIVEIDTEDTNRIAYLRKWLDDTVSILPEARGVVYEPGTKETPLDDPAYVVRIGVYAYLAEPSTVGKAVVGQWADVEARNGGHWAGKITAIEEVEWYEDYVGDLPSLNVLGVSWTKP